MRSTSPRAGYTLLELMTTMALAAMLMGVGAAALMSGGRKTAYQQALSDVAGLLSKARVASSHLPAAIVVDAEEGRIFGMTESVIQELHFEPIPPPEGESADDADVVIANGINGLTVEDMGGMPVDDGRVGGGLRLDGGFVNCGKYANYDVTDGLGFEIWVKPTASPRGRIVSKGAAFSLKFDGPDRLHVQILVDDPGGQQEVSRPVPLKAPIRIGEWIGLTVTYDRKHLVVSTDLGYGPVERDRHPETRPLRPDDQAPLLLGDTNFRGIIDDFRLSGVHVDDPIRLPDGVQVVGEGQTIRFSSGRLDADAHPGVVRLGLSFGERVSTFEIGQNGVVQNMIYTGDLPTATPATGVSRDDAGSQKTE